jgi:hypothetical protein
MEKHDQARSGMLNNVKRPTPRRHRWRHFQKKCAALMSPWSAQAAPAKTAAQEIKPSRQSHATAIAWWKGLRYPSQPNKAHSRPSNYVAIGYKDMFIWTCP